IIKMNSRSFWPFLLLFEIFLSTTWGWMESNGSRQFSSGAERLTQEESRSFEIRRKK
ncbi:hypothetical protein JRQ81_002649, partial [Phrynocephalus forsythii]